MGKFANRKTSNIFYANLLGITLFLLSMVHVCWGSEKKFEVLELDALLNMSLEELLQVPIIKTASGIEENLVDAPATMVVITSEDIKNRGYTDLTEVVADLPGFDVMNYNGTAQIMAYQRGYRTPFTSRTLFMIDGIVDNEMARHEAVISRQYPLSNIKRIEVLYGPASAVYGPNAFLGIINVITHNAAKLNEGEYKAEVNGLMGSYNSKGLEIFFQGKPTKDLAFSLTYKHFKSDEPDFTGKYGFLDQHWMNDEQIWGPLLNIEHEGRQFGEYYDPTDDYGVFADVKYQDWKLGIIHWRTSEAYGPYYAADHVQNNAFLKKTSNHVYLEYTPQLTDKLKSHTLVEYRENPRYGQWAEGHPDSTPDMENYSYISFTHWNTENSTWLFRQDFDFQVSEYFLLAAGIKYERKELTKISDSPGYWEGSSVSSTAESGSAIGHSSDPVYILPPLPGTMPADNLAHTTDKGIYIQGIYDWDKYRYSLGIRYDKNSMYGDVINPRTSLVFRHNKQFTFKLLYGEAFQEPAPQLLWAGWSGREANADLRPEKARTLETVAMYHHKDVIQEASLYRSRYSNVIKEEAENAGSRDIYGFEYRTKIKIPHFLKNVKKPEIYFNYTYTRSKSSTYYDHDVGEWLDGTATLGDIAPHKFNLGLNLPLDHSWNLNLRGNFVGERELYLRNPLRAQGEKTDAYFVLNSALRYNYDPFEITFKINNVLNEHYFHPGPEAASSGNDFSQRALGYHNSLIPQPERSWWLNVKWTFEAK